MWFLGRFNNDEIQILNESNEFLSVQQYLENELLAMESGKRDFVGMDELENHLEKSIRKYEGKQIIEVFGFSKWQDKPFK